MTTLIVGSTILLARNAMQRIVLERALARNRYEPFSCYFSRPRRGLDRCLLGNADYILLDARRPDLLLQSDMNAIDRVVVEGHLPLVARWVVAGIKFNNAIE